MPDSLGARLRQRREEHGIDLIAIAAQTKIKLSLLEGLERDDVSQWPAGIFRRAYIRSYAQSIGLDPDAAVREFQDAHPERDEEVTTEAIASTLAGSRGAAGPPTRFRFLVGSAIGSLARLRRTPAVEEPLCQTRDARESDRRSRSVLDLPASPLPVQQAHLVPEIVIEAVSPMSPMPAAPAGDDRPSSAERPEPPAPSTPQIDQHDWLAFAELCTRVARVDAPHQVRSLLQEAAALLNAGGMIVWVWDAALEALMPALAHGYSDRVLASLPGVGRDEDNATAAAFRTARPCTFTGDERTGGALTVPLMAPDGCAGVLAIELPCGREETASVRAAATILAALLSQLVGNVRTSEAQPHADLVVSRAAQAGGQAFRAARR